MSLIVRKARKPYVCDCCGKIIAAGDEYIDDVVIKYGNVVHHKRYHDECPARMAVEWLFKRIVAADGDLICSTPEGEKYHIYGVAYMVSAWCANVRSWKGKDKYLPITAMESWIDEHGERILKGGKA